MRTLIGIVSCEVTSHKNDYFFFFDEFTARTYRKIKQPAPVAAAAAVTATVPRFGLQSVEKICALAERQER